MNKSALKTISLWTMAFVYMGGGVNHFVNPEFYIPLIPDYFPSPNFLNAFAGVAEMVFGLALLFPISRRNASYGIIVMLIAFIPAHVYFIQIGSCIDVEARLCVPEWLGWLRLILIHPLLMLWAWWHRQ